MIALFSDMVRLWRLIASRLTVYLLMTAGLSLSFGVAIVILLYGQSELTYDRAIAGADRIYVLTANYGPQGRPLVASDIIPAGMARWMKAETPGLDQVARLSPVEWPMQTVRRRVKERFYWADANFFRIVQLPALHGDAKTALNAPYSVVLTARMAQAYFGRENAVGETLYTKGNSPLKVTAVLRDFPANIHLDREIFVSGTTHYAMLSIFDARPDYLWPSTYTYVTFKGEIQPDRVEADLRDLSRRNWQGPNNLPEGFALVPLLDLHFRPHGDAEMKPRGHLTSILALGAVGLIILALAGINFSGLVLAESNRRSSEMALRAALGARRSDHVSAILRESLCVNAVSAVLALALTERLLPALNRSLDLDLSLWLHPVSLLAFLALIVLVVAGLSGLYPAVVISRPRLSAGYDVTQRWRGWVVAQLSLVVVLLIASHTMSRQWDFAMQDASRLKGDNVVMIRLSDEAAANALFRSHIAAVPGVQSVADSWGAPTNEYARPGWVNRPNGLVAFTRTSVHPDFFKVYKVPLVAGRNLSGTFLFPEVPEEILINRAAVKALGFNGPEAAIGQDITYETDRTLMHSRIVGVLPDLRFSTLYEPAQPMIFDNFSKYFTHINVRLDEAGQAETLARIDALWDEDTGHTVPVDRRFFREYLLEQYHDLHQQMRVFNLVAAVAIILSTLGLTGLSIFLTRHQVRDIAIHRALGATLADIFWFRLTPFLVPFLIANLIGWPLAWLAVRVWLRAFSEHVALSWSSFLGASVIAFVFALITVAAHSALTARQVSVASLRSGSRGV